MPSVTSLWPSSTRPLRVRRLYVIRAPEKASCPLENSGLPMMESGETAWPCAMRRSSRVRNRMRCAVRLIPAADSRALPRRVITLASRSYSISSAAYRTESVDTLSGKPPNVAKRSPAAVEGSWARRAAGNQGRSSTAILHSPRANLKARGTRGARSPGCIAISGGSRGFAQDGDSDLAVPWAVELTKEYPLPRTQLDFPRFDRYGDG